MSLRGSRATPRGVPYPKNRKELQAMDSHVYGQLTASLSTEATRTIADDFYRNRGGGGGGGGGGGPQGPPGPPGNRGSRSPPGKKGPQGDEGPGGRKVQAAIRVQTARLLSGAVVAGRVAAGRAAATYPTSCPHRYQPATHLRPPLALVPLLWRWIR